MAPFQRRKSISSLHHHRLAAEKPGKAATIPEDEQFWNAIKTSAVAGLFEDFVKRYPNSSHLDEARERIRSLSSQTAATRIASADPKSGTTQRSPSPDEIARFGKLASDLKMQLPAFSIAAIKGDVPKAMRNLSVSGSTRTVTRELDARPCSS
jgi:hypothetical protein